MSHIRCHTQYRIHGQEFDKNSPSGVFAPKAGSPEGEQVGLFDGDRRQCAFLDICVREKKGFPLSIVHSQDVWGAPGSVPCFSSWLPIWGWA